MNKHTPGPWHLSKHGEAILSYDNTGIGERIIAKTLGTVNTLSERKANASLIAAAPDMHEVIENLMWIMSGRDDLYDDEKRLLDKAKRILAKAEGERE